MLAAIFISAVFASGAVNGVIDRIAVTVGRTVITQSEIEREIRITALLNGEPLDLSVENRRRAAERLVERALVQREMTLNRYPEAQLVEASSMLDGFKGNFKNESDYRAALARYHISEEDLRNHMLSQLTFLRFIEFRFQPGAQVAGPEVERYYKEVFVPEARKKGAAEIPGLEEVRQDIEKVLTSQAVDRSLDRWLKDMRAQVPIEYREGAF
jgi:hypothetical protein